MSKQRKLKFGALIHGVGGNISGWRHPDIQADASVSLEFYKSRLRRLKRESSI